MRRRSTALLVLVAAVLSAPSGAHVQPSPDVNNRYLKLTAMPDRVRLAYTVWMGEQPGARERLRLDADRDGQLSDAEAAVFRDRLAADVAGALEVMADGRDWEPRWDQTHIGLGTPAVDAGSFSVDLIGWICLDGGAAEHRVVLFDRFRIGDPGETEVRIEESPEVEVTQSSLGPSGTSMREMKWNGGAGPARTDGIHLVYEVEKGGRARSGGERGEADPCFGRGPGQNQKTPSSRWTTWSSGLVVLGLAVLGAAIGVLGFRARARARD